MITRLSSMIADFFVAVIQRRSDPLVEREV